MLSLSIPFQFPLRSQIQRVPKSVPNQFPISSHVVPSQFPISSHVVPNQFPNSFIFCSQRGHAFFLFSTAYTFQDPLPFLYLCVWAASLFIVERRVRSWQEKELTDFNKLERHRKREKQREKQRHREKSRDTERQRERSLIIWRWDWKQSNLGCKGCL